MFSLILLCSPGLIGVYLLGLMVGHRRSDKFLEQCYSNGYKLGRKHGEEAGMFRAKHPHMIPASVGTHGPEPTFWLPP